MGAITLLKYFLYSSLLLASSCFVNKTYAFASADESNHHQFHSVVVASLLPASVCSSSTSGEGYGKTQSSSTLEVIHRHGPCSKHKSSTKLSLSDILTRDQSRVKSINARLSPKPNTDKINDKKATIPAQSGQSLGSGNYLVKIGIGSPAKTLSLIFDTGSDLTWTQCQPCFRYCYQQTDPIFNPKVSTSYRNISCASTQCSQLSTATGNTPSCSTSTCVYGIQYGDQSFSVGFFSQDKLTISSTDVFQGFLFGCGQNNQGLFGNTAGLLGLGRNPLSIVSQTAAKYGKLFSYCLPSTSSSTGYLAFGNSGKPSTNVKYTLFSTSQGSSFYFIDILAITVGGQQLSISQSVFSNGGTIIDSGTVITRLPPAAYTALSSKFKQLMSRYPSAPAYSILDTCYDFSNYTSVSIPTISFTYGGNVVVNLDSSGILVLVSSSRACLAFAGNSDASDIGILGNIQQKKLQVIYDVAGGRLGFGAAGC